MSRIRSRRARVRRGVRRRTRCDGELDRSLLGSPDDARQGPRRRRDRSATDGGPRRGRANGRDRLRHELAHPAHARLGREASRRVSPRCALLGPGYRLPHRGRGRRSSSRSRCGTGTSFSSAAVIRRSARATSTASRAAFGRAASAASPAGSSATRLTSTPGGTHRGGSRDSLGIESRPLSALSVEGVPVRGLNGSAAAAARALRDSARDGGASTSSDARARDGRRATPSPLAIDLSAPLVDDRAPHEPRERQLRSGDAAEAARCDWSRAGASSAAGARVVRDDARAAGSAARRRSHRRRLRALARSTASRRGRSWRSSGLERSDPSIRRRLRRPRSRSPVSRGRWSERLGRRARRAGG